MNRTPADTRCPTADAWRRLLLRTLPAAEAVRLEDHARTCQACRQVLQAIRGETVSTAIPSLPEPSDDTRHGEPADVPSDVVWSSHFTLEGGAAGRPPTAAAAVPPAAKRPSFAFLAPPREAGELGWLGIYRIVGVLGEGGMGVVFDAQDTHLQRRVALKVLRPELAVNLGFRERFLQEARAAAGLSSDHVITIYQVGMENDVPYLAMQYLSGETLEQRVRREGRLPAAEVMRIGREVAEGLAAAHDKGLVHRDIKPANVWLESPPPSPLGGEGSGVRGGRVKILDFGLARLVHDPRRLTASGHIVGTPSYLAPEQARGHALDGRCDLFSLGCVLYRLSTGVLPFDGPDTLAQLAALAAADPRPVAELAPDVPAGLRELIHRLLARDPADRPQSAREVAAQLRTLEQAGTGESPAPPADTRPQVRRLPVPPTSRPRRRRAHYAWWGGLVLLCLALGGGLVLWRALAVPPPPPGEPIKVGLLFSHTGPMAAGGMAASDAALLAIEEINDQGGLLGRPIEPVVVDGASDAREHARLARRLITEDGVRVLVGCRSSASRKMVRPVVEEHDHLLLYPMQFEGLEQSPNIVYLGAAPNQQILPAVRYAVGMMGKRRLFLVGSDYVFPRTANEIIRDALKGQPDVQVVGEKYIPFGSSDVAEAVRAIRKAEPDLVLNTINGDTNAAFFRALRAAGVTAERTPVLSFSLGENDLRSFSASGKDMVGHYAAWNYFQSIDRPENEAFVRKFKDRFGPTRVVSDPMEATYVGVHLWAQAVRAAGTDDPAAVRRALKGQSLDAPEGRVRVDPKTQYTWKVVRMGRVVPGSQFDIQWSSDKPIAPEPFPPTRTRQAWEQFLQKLYDDWAGHWEAP
jgi:urea transport system substrate-binding protein